MSKMGSGGNREQRRKRADRVARQRAAHGRRRRALVQPALQHFGAMPFPFFGGVR